MRRYLIVATCLLIGCEVPDTRNCPPISHSGANSYQLEYELLIPTDCPVPLGVPGEDPKYAAAIIYDNGNPDFYYGVAEVENSNRLLLNSDRTLFGRGPDNREQARPTVFYLAATGQRTYTDRDYGFFVATNREFGNNSSDPYGEIEITYIKTGLVARGVEGPEIPPRNTTQTWSVQASGGATPYSYAWYRNGVHVGSGSSYTASTGTADYGLRVEVVDHTTAMRASVLAVDVDGVRASISGPSLTYASEGGGTWTAGGSGGTQPHTFSWYVDGEFVGSGASWSGYPGEGRHELRVRMVDAADASDIMSMGVTGLGSGDGTCDPVPPALTCSP